MHFVFYKNDDAHQRVRNHFPECEIGLLTLHFMLWKIKLELGTGAAERHLFNSYTFIPQPSNILALPGPSLLHLLLLRVKSIKLGHICSRQLENLSST
jgi:hypothetical protein